MSKLKISKSKSQELPSLVDASSPKIETRRSPSRSTNKQSVRRSSPPLKEPYVLAGKTKKTSPRRSPTRKSPSRRSPTRKSPSRKSPSRKSPTRNAPLRKSLSQKSPSRNKSPPRRSPARTIKTYADIKKSEKGISKAKGAINIDSDPDWQEFEKKEKPKATVRGRSRIADVDKHVQEITEDYYQNSVLTRRSTRLAQQSDNERIVHLKDAELLKDAEVIRSSLQEYSDEEEKEVVPYKKTPFTEFGGTVGSTFIMISVTLSAFIMNAVCNEQNCSWKINRQQNWRKYTQIGTYVDAITIVACLAYVTVFALLNALPFGGRKVTGLLSKHGRFDYCANGFFIAVVMVLLAFGIEYYNIKLFSFIYEKHLKITSIIVIFGLLLSTYLYIRSFYVPVSALNTHIINNSNLYNFYIGREINPRLFGVLDWKMFLLRYLAVSLILINIAYLYKYFGPEFQFSKLLELKNVNETLLCICFIQIVFALDTLIYEATFLSSFEIYTEGLGFMGAFGYFVYPHLVGMFSKFILDHNVRLCRVDSYLTTFVFLFGLILARVTDRQKHAFRLNPYSPAVAHLKSIPTTQGKRLLISGYWGVVRHPNYVGHILMCLAWMRFVISTPLSILMVGNIVLLLHRCLRDGRRCKEKYGASWDAYCNQVKYILVPKIF